MSKDSICYRVVHSKVNDGFGEIKDKVLEEAIGLENVPLDSEKRAKAVAVFKAMAWAVGGNNGG